MQRISASEICFDLFAEEEYCKREPSVCASASESDDQVDRKAVAVATKIGSGYPVRETKSTSVQP